MKRSILKLSAVILATAIMVFNISCTDSETDADAVLSVNPSVTDVELDADGALAFSNGMPVSTEFMVATNQDTWEVAANQPWLHIIKMSHGFIMFADPNPTVSTLLTAEVTVTSGNATPVTIGVQQAASGPVLKVSPTARDITIASEGGNEVAKFTVTTNVGEWAVVSSNESWLTVNKSENGFTLSAAQNSVISGRDAEITVSASGASNVVIRVSQEGNITIIDFNDMIKVDKANGAQYPIYHYIDLNLTQGEALKVINVPNGAGWWIDPTFFTKLTNDVFTFACMDGEYRFCAIPGLKLFYVNSMSADMQPDGTGGIWLKGPGIGKPSLEIFEVGWGTVDRIPMARMGEKINRIIFIAGVSVRENASLYFHYQDNDWAPTLDNLDTTTPGPIWWWEGGRGAVMIGPMEADSTYELIIDTTGGRDNPVASLTKLD